MSKTIGFLVAAALLAGTAPAAAFSKQGVRRHDVPVEDQAKNEARGTHPPTTEAPNAPLLKRERSDSLTPEESAAELLALAGFLVMIFGLLIHWSGDQSCKDERSVFSSSP